MEPTIAPIDATLGAVVTDLDLARMDARPWKTAEQAFHEYAVLVFPAQGLTEAAQVAFATRVGAEAAMNQELVEVDGVTADPGP